MIVARVSGDPAGIGLFAVESNSVDGIFWRVEILTGRRVVCPCIGYQTRKTCRHAEAVRAVWNAEPRPPLEAQLGASLEQARAAREARMRETEALLAN